MKNFKINKNQNPLSDEDIAKGKNFDNLFKTYSGMKTPIFKTAKFWFGGSALVVASVTALLLYTKSFDSINSTEPFINPPIAKADIKNESFIIDADKDSTIIYNSGSKIHVPAHAFTDKNGKPVNGLVELNYREFQKISEVFLAGIPMTYDSAGEKFTFETAGMMEISASQNGMALQTNPNALIHVDMVSHNNQDRFNSYYLDTVDKKWNYLEQSNFTGASVPEEDEQNTANSLLQGDSSGVSELLPSKGNYGSDTVITDPVFQKVGKEVADTKKEIALIERERPIKPEKLSPKKPRFSIKVDKNEFPEIAVYENVKFQVVDSRYDATKADIVWENVDLKRLPNSDKYEITFSTSTQKYQVTAMPVLENKDYAAAKQVYDEKYKEYQQALTTKKQEEAALQAQLAQRRKEMEAHIKQEIAEQDSLQKVYNMREEQTALVWRSFSVARFGIYNCDCPSRMPGGAEFKAQLKDAKTGQPLTVQYLYLVEKGKNLMYTYYPNKLYDFKFNPNAQNMVWAVTSDLRLAVLKPDAFKAAPINGQNMTLELNVIDKKFESTGDAMRFLEI